MDWFEQLKKAFEEAFEFNWGRKKRKKRKEKNKRKGSFLTF